MGDFSDDTLNIASLGTEVSWLWRTPPYQVETQGFRFDGTKRNGIRRPYSHLSSVATYSHSVQGTAEFTRAICNSYSRGRPSAY